MSIDNATPEDWNHIHLGNLLKEKLEQPRHQQVGGNHYMKSIQPWDVWHAWDLDPWLANVVKYVARHKDKNGKEDLEKALHCLRYAISNYEVIYASR